MGLVNLASIRSKIESAVNSSVDEIIKNPDMDTDVLQKRIEKEMGIDSITSKFGELQDENAILGKATKIIADPKKAAVDYISEVVDEHSSDSVIMGKVKEVKDIAINPQQAAVNFINQKIEEDPKVKELRDKLLTYVREKVESIPAIQKIKKDLEDAMAPPRTEFGSTDSTDAPVQQYNTSGTSKATFGKMGRSYSDLTNNLNTDYGNSKSGAAIPIKKASTKRIKGKSKKRKRNNSR